MAGVFFVYEGAGARRCRRRTRPCVFVCCVFVCCCCCCCCCCSCTPGFVVWLVRMCKVLFTSCSGSESLPLRLQQSELRGGQGPHHLSPIFHRHPRHLGVVFYRKLKNVSCGVVFFKKLKNVSCEYDRVNG